MYGKWVTLALTDEMVVKVFVWCGHGASEEELRRDALQTLRAFLAIESVAARKA